MKPGQTRIFTDSWTAENEQLVVMRVDLLQLLV